MKKYELDRLIISGGFPGLLMEINRIQHNYRNQLDAQEEKLEALEVEYRSGLYTKQWKDQQYAQIMERVKSIEAKAAAELMEAKQAYLKAVEDFHKPDGEQLPAGLLDLLHSDILDAEELLKLAAEHSNNPTAYRVIAKEANKNSDCLAVPNYQRGREETQILESYLSGTWGLTHSSGDWKFHNAWSEEILSKAIQQLNRLPVRPQTKPSTMEELRAALEKEQEENNREKQGGKAADIKAPTLRTEKA